jgi:AraC-like DNA-binding protein
MKKIEKKGDPSTALSGYRFCYYECLATPSCDVVELYPSTTPVLLFNFSPAKVYLHGALLPPVVLLPLTNQARRVTFTSHLQMALLHWPPTWLPSAIQPELRAEPFGTVLGWEVLHAGLARSIAVDAWEAAFTQLLHHLPGLAGTLFMAPPAAALDPWPALTTLSGMQRKSLRRLERMFQKQLGVSPRTYRQLQRYEQIEQHLWQTPGQSLTQLAYEFDFADQAHFIKTIRRMTGQTPGQWRRKIQCIKGQSLER